MSPLTLLSPLILLDISLFSVNGKCCRGIMSYCSDLERADIFCWYLNSGYEPCNFIVDTCVTVLKSFRHLVLRCRNKFRYADGILSAATVEEPRSSCLLPYVRHKSYPSRMYWTYWCRPANILCNADPALHDEHAIHCCGTGSDTITVTVCGGRGVSLPLLD
jgi:hypothetical protein